MEYPDYIKRASSAACEELIKEFMPEFTQANAQKFLTFQERLEMGIYIELLKAGLMVKNL